MGEFKILITTSGIGSRLGELTNYTNKSLIRIGKKPAISYIIENYPKNSKFVITLGYFGNQIKDFLSLAYPDLNIEYVNVENYSGEGSSLGYSMLCAKEKLQCPFIFHACDTIVTEKVPVPDKNWVIGCKKISNSQYRLIKNTKPLKFFQKGQLDDENICYIGICGINDYENFWSSLEKLYQKNPSNNQLNDCDAINLMEANFNLVEFKKWFDIGSSSELIHARNNIDDNFQILDKIDESIFIFNDFVIKFFYDKTICSNRVKRYKYLDKLIPDLIDSKDNFYKYKYCEGELLSKVINEDIFLSFLNWCKTNLWIKLDKKINFSEKCEQFYFKKTNERIKSFVDKDLNADATTINNINIPDISSIINSIDKEWLCNSEPYKFHGDLIADNVLYISDDNFMLLDWRQDFAGELEYGDIYYDLAKLNHNLMFNHDIVNKKLYTLENKENKIFCDILCSKRLIDCQKVLHKFIIDNGFDLNKVEVLTYIIWLNMSPLHTYPLNSFLFNFGKLNLYKKLKTWNTIN